MAPKFKGTINLDVRDSVPDWEPYAQPKAPDGSPNVIFLVWDDTGIGALEPFGGPIQVPNMKRLADNGLRYTQFHTTAICSPTRAALLTGRNHTTVGMACIAEATTGFPGSNGHIPFETATIAEVLGERGYNTYMLGKWHCVAEDETEHGILQAQLADRPRVRALSTASSAAKPISGIPTSCRISSSSSSPKARPRTARSGLRDSATNTTCRRIWSTVRSA